MMFCFKRIYCNAHQIVNILHQATIHNKSSDNKYTVEN